MIFGCEFQQLTGCVDTPGANMKWKSIQGGSDVAKASKFAAIEFKWAKSLNGCESITLT